MPMSEPLSIPVSSGALALQAMQEADCKPVQMDLLKLADLPACLPVVEMIERRSFIGDADTAALQAKFRGFTGKIVLRKLLSNEELATAICLAIQSGMSERLIAARFGISTHSIPRIKHAMTERGELAAVRRRVDALLDRFVEVGFETIIEGLLSGTINPNSVSIAVIAADDKRRQRDAGLVPGTEKTEEEISLEKVKAQFALLKVAKGATEVDSGGIPLKRPVIDVSSAGDTPQATPGTVPPAAPMAVPGPAAAPASASSPASGDQGAESGGGVAAAPDPDRGDGKGIGNPEG